MAVRLAIGLVSRSLVAFFPRREVVRYWCSDHMDASKGYEA
jgi:hypothetical protein